MAREKRGFTREDWAVVSWVIWAMAMGMILGFAGRLLYLIFSHPLP